MEDTSLLGVLGSELAAKLQEATATTSTSSEDDTDQNSNSLWNQIEAKWSLFQKENEQLNVQREKENVVKGSLH